IAQRWPQRSPERWCTPLFRAGDLISPTVQSRVASPWLRGQNVAKCPRFSKREFLIGDRRLPEHGRVAPAGASSYVPEVFLFHRLSAGAGRNVDESSDRPRGLTRATLAALSSNPRRA